MTPGIYKLVNTKNNRFYIGSSQNIEERIKRHIRKLKKNTHENKYLQNDFNKTIHSSPNDLINCLFLGELIEKIDNETGRLNRETEFLIKFHDKQNNCYNLNKTAYIIGRVKTANGLRRLRLAASKNAKNLWKSPKFLEARRLMHLTKEWKQNRGRFNISKFKIL